MTMKAITILQPFAHFVAIGEKPVENRDWDTDFRGLVAIHAGKSLYQDHIDFCSRLARTEFDVDELDYGAVIAVAELTRVVQKHRSPWFVGKHGFVLEDVRPLRKPVPCPGQVRFWTLPARIEKRVVSLL